MFNWLAGSRAGVASTRHTVHCITVGETLVFRWPIARPPSISGRQKCPARLPASMQGFTCLRYFCATYPFVTFPCSTPRHIPFHAASKLLIDKISPSPNRAWFEIFLKPVPHQKNVNANVPQVGDNRDAGLAYIYYFFALWIAKLAHMSRSYGSDFLFTAESLFWCFLGNILMSRDTARRSHCCWTHWLHHWNVCFSPFSAQCSSLHIMILGTIQALSNKLTMPPGTNNISAKVSD